MSERRTIRTDYLARVEGEGSLTVQIDGSRVERAELRIFEPPRFFEALLRGRMFAEAPDITARICGICPVAYQTSSMNAMENLCGVEVPEPIRMLRRLLYCGEWIESHALHIYMLHAPDFLGYPGAVELARDAPQIVERGLQLKKTGNEVMRLVGGREIHPINVRVGGFYKAPSKRELEALIEPLERAREAAPRLSVGLQASSSQSGRSNANWSRYRTLMTMRSSAGGSAQTAGSTSMPPSTRNTSRRSMSSAQRRCIRACASAAPICAGRWPATHSTTTSSLRSRASSRARRGSERRAGTRFEASSCAASSSSMPAMRRYG